MKKKRLSDARAISLVDNVRRFTDTLFVDLHAMKRELSADDYERWKARSAAVLGAMGKQIMDPLYESHPNVMPKSIGGSGPDRSLEGRGRQMGPRRK